MVASELQSKRSTIIDDFIASGPMLVQLIDDLMALPPTAFERVLAEPLLTWLRDTLPKRHRHQATSGQARPERSDQNAGSQHAEVPKRTREDSEFITTTMHDAWETARSQGLIEGHLRGLAQGHAETEANAVLTVLRVRGIAVPEAARKRILAEKDLQRLERWFEKAIIATSLREVIGDRAAGRTSKAARPAAYKERSGRRSARAAAQR